MCLERSSLVKAAAKHCPSVVVLKLGILSCEWACFLLHKETRASGLPAEARLGCGVVHRSVAN